MINPDAQPIETTIDKESEIVMMTHKLCKNNDSNPEMIHKLVNQFNSLNDDFQICLKGENIFLYHRICIKGLLDDVIDEEQQTFNKMVQKHSLTLKSIFSGERKQSTNKKFFLDFSKEVSEMLGMKK